MGTSHLPALQLGWLESSRKAVMSIAFKGSMHKVEQIAYETDDFVVYELQDHIRLDGKDEKYLAVTQQASLYTIDVFAGSKGLLTNCHGSVSIEWA